MLIKPFVLGVAGGSGSGKTYFAKALKKLLDDKKGNGYATILSQDNYYIDQSRRFDSDGGSVNFDHPESLEFTLLANHLEKLKHNESVAIPQYDFKTHSRLTETTLMKPTPVIIVDGILVLDSVHVREQFDEAVFFDTPESLRFARRMERDVMERGRTPAGVKKQFETQVAPMHEKFVEPSKVHAQIIIHNLDEYKIQLSQLVNQLTKLG